MPSFDKLPSLMPVVITQEVWQSAVEFPSDAGREADRLSNLLLSALLTLRTAGPARENIVFTLYCLTPRGDTKVPVPLPLRLIRAEHHLMISLAEIA